MKINTKIIEELNPCKDRFDNWKVHYYIFNGSIVKFLKLENITHSDKLWVALRILPKELVEIFAIDCALAAQFSYYAIDASYITSAVSTAYVAYAHADAYAAAYTTTYAAAAADISADVSAYAAAYTAAEIAYAYAAANVSAHAANATYAAANYAANAAADYATYNKAKEKEQENQINALIYLIETEKK